MVALPPPRRAQGLTKMSIAEIATLLSGFMIFAAIWGTAHHLTR